MIAHDVLCCGGLRRVMQQKRPDLGAFQLVPNMHAEAAR